MEAKELRIGNLTLNEKGELYKVDWINKHIEEQLSPIPLTEEWLLKFGFEKVDYEKNYPLYFNKNKDGYMHSISVSVHSDFCRINVVTQSLRTFKHLHELQNLYFALTNKELTLKSD